MVDEKRRMVGVVDVGVLTNEVFDVAERASGMRCSRLSAFACPSPRRISCWWLSLSASWLMATIGSGTICAPFWRAPMR
ncbi:MAG: hypothetical protein MZV70_76045 [Desulfobacterales bacterium]|nr:hypothetical protein [Desulfobacterales bacterium]